MARVCLRRSYLVLGFLALFLLLAAGGSPVPSPSFVTLDPDGQRVIQEDLTVNVVRVGFEGVIDPDEFAAYLPQQNWVARAGDGAGRDAEFAYTYTYNIVDAPADFEDFFFGSFLSAIAQAQNPLDYSFFFPDLPPIPITLDQAVYNYCNIDQSVLPGTACASDPAAPRVNPRMIEQNWILDAPLVELVLSLNMPFLGVDATNPTVVLINWWGRDDYRDHTYANLDEPAPESGVHRGAFIENLLGGWGGTPSDDPQTCALLPCQDHRLWFFDLSAGPFFRTHGWDLVSPESRTSQWNGIPDYRLHHTADYLDADGTYRELDTLSADLAKVVGDVFLGLIATPAHVYPTDLTPPALPEAIEIDINRFRWGDVRDLDALFDRSVVESTLNKLPYSFTTELREPGDPADGRLADAASPFVQGVFDGAIYGGRFSWYEWAETFLYWRDHVGEFQNGDADYEISVLHFAMGPSPTRAIAGYADGNYATFNLYPNADGADLRQAEIVMVTGPDDAPYDSQSLVLEHEVGHHLGLHHTFQGSRCGDSDCENLRIFAANDDTMYTTVGNFVHGVMTYMDLNNDFSRFERDNVNRWVAYQHLRYADQLLAGILERPKSTQVHDMLGEADALASEALAAIGAMDYEAAASLSRASYQTLSAAAARVNLKVEPYARNADDRTPPDHHHLARKQLEEFLALDPAMLTKGLAGVELQPEYAKLADAVNQRWDVESIDVQDGTVGTRWLWSPETVPE